jgi:hypothetical protein
MGLPFLGCFKDNNNRDLNGIAGVDNPEACFKKARDLGYEFAAM